MDYHTIDSAIEELRVIDGVTFDRMNEGLLSQHTVDFTVGPSSAYPSPLKEDLPKMLSTSSVVLVENEEGHALCKEANIHLPPFRHEQREQLEAELALPSFFEVRYGTTVLGSVTPAPDWGLTPHIYTSDRVTAKRMLTAVRRSARAIEYVEPMSVDEVREAYQNT